jgi:hypothetical protein
MRSEVNSEKIATKKTIGSPTVNSSVYFRAVLKVFFFMALAGLNGGIG